MFEPLKEKLQALYGETKDWLDGEEVARENVSKAEEALKLANEKLGEYNAENVAKAKAFFVELEDELGLTVKEEAKEEVAEEVNPEVQPDVQPIV